MIKSEKLRDFKTQKQKNQAVQNTEIYNIGIVTCQENMGTNYFIQGMFGIKE